MKVVQLLPELNEGGVERGTVELNREMVRHGIESVVISAGGKLVERIDMDGGRHIRFDVCSKNPLTAPQRVYQLRKLLKTIAPDIIHARSRVPAWLTYLANKTLKIPFVTTVHGFNSVNAYSRVMTYGDRIICVSGAIKDYIKCHYSVAEEKTVVVPRGVDLDLFNPDDIDHTFILNFIAKFNLDEKYVVTSVGRVTQLKDYETFIRGIVSARKKVPNICGLIVGGVRSDKQSYFDSLKKLVTEFEANSFVHFVGSQTKIAEIYAISDLVAVCSKKPESFGRTAAEALAMNVPVVATAHGGTLDVVIPRKTGYLFMPEDVASLAEAIIHNKEVAWQGLRQFVERNFTLEQMSAATFNVYREMVCCRQN